MSDDEQIDFAMLIQSRQQPEVSQPQHERKLKLMQLQLSKSERNGDRDNEIHNLKNSPKPTIAFNASSANRKSGSSSESIAIKPSESLVASALAKLTARRGTSSEAKAKTERAANACYSYATELEFFFSSSQCLENTAAISDIDDRRSYAKLCATIIQVSPSFALQNNLDVRLWKIGFYSVIEAIRSHIASTNEPIESYAKASWAALIGIGVQTFTGIVSAVHRTRISSNDSKQSPSQPAYAKFVGWLGDLARYRVILDVDGSLGNLNMGEGVPDVLKSWSNAKTMYKVASFLAPTNGQFYNHLAIFDLNSSDSIGSLCNFVRALNVKVPFQSARDAIVSLCAGIRSIHQETLKSTSKTANSKHNKSTNNKKGSVSKYSESCESIFIRCFEVLYTKINVDTLPSLLSAVNATISSTTKLPSAFLSQAIILCISLLATLNLSPTASDHDLGILRLTDVLLFTILCRQDDNDSLIALRLFLAYLQSPTAVSNISSCTARIRVFDKQWHAFAGIAVRPPVSPSQRSLLPEDWMYRGFMPLREILPRKAFDEVVKTRKGASMFEFYSDDMTGNVDRSLIVKEELWDVLKCLGWFEMDEVTQKLRYIEPSLETFEEVTEVVQFNALHSQEINADKVEGEATLKETFKFLDIEDDDYQDFPDVNGLKERKTQLSLISKSVSETSVASKMSKSPKRLKKSSTLLLFDTNCYVSSCDEIIKLLNSGWTIVLPLAVITELDGLASGGHLEAVMALSLIEPLILSRNAKPANLALVTYRGTKLPYLSVRTEDWGNGKDDVHGVDDILLRCTQKLAEDVQKSGDVVVLVTGDNNLRLKARGAGVLTGSMMDLKKLIT
ncbi:hypothetical protein HK100_011716 [Physocladia obscura]|uniref:PIN domain-containing protein n=1 Tax=Physocladia obscura TaxID=109957 RepID=A0AAD5XHU4_9FUNG|nr:hypothetical protein HK100_011716 [Physocladia obscura]